MLLQQGGAFLACHCGIFGYEILDGIGAHWPTTCAGEQDLGTIFSLFPNPCCEHTDRRFRQGCTALLPSFSLASNVGTRMEEDVAFTQSRETIPMC